MKGRAWMDWRYLEVACKTEVRNPCASVCSSDSESLGSGVGAGDSRRASVAVGCSTKYNGSNWVTVTDRIFEPFHDDSTDRLRFDIAIRRCIKCVAQACWLSVEVPVSTALVERS